MAFGGTGRDITVRLLADVDKFQKDMKAAGNSTDQFSNGVNDSLKKLGVAAAAAGAAVVAMASKFAVDAVRAASDLQETISKTNVLFGDSADSVQNFASAAASSFGQSKQQALDAAATFATFGRAAGLAGEDLVTFSTDFVGLASDLASFNNTTPEQAINAIGSALRGESEPLRQFGVLLNDATLKNAALELGLISTTKNALTPQQKVLAAQKVIYEQTTAAQGDFARTSDGLANQQRILTAELQNARVEIGEELLPIALVFAEFLLETVVPIIKNDVIPKVIEFIEVLQDLASEIKENVEDAYRGFIESNQDLRIALGDTSKAAKDQKNILDFLKLAFVDISASVVAGFFNTMTILNNAIRIAYELSLALALVVQGDLRGAYEAAKRALDPAVRAQERYNEQVAEGYRQFQNYNRVVNNVTGSLANAYRQFSELSEQQTKIVIPSFDTAAKSIDKVTESTKKATEATKKLTAEQIKQAQIQLEMDVSDMADPTGALAVAEARRKRAEAALGPKGSQIDRPIVFGDAGKAKPITDLFLDSILAAGNPNNVNAAWNDILKDATQFVTGKGGQFGLFNAQGQLIGGGGGGPQLGTEGAIPSQITINVSGAITDPEGAARAVSNVLSGSSNRVGALVTSTTFGVE